MFKVLLFAVVFVFAHGVSIVTSPAYSDKGSTIEQRRAATQYMSALSSMAWCRAKHGVDKFDFETVGQAAYSKLRDEINRPEVPPELRKFYKVLYNRLKTPSLASTLFRFDKNGNRILRTIETFEDCKALAENFPPVPDLMPVETERDI